MGGISWRVGGTVTAAVALGFGGLAAVVGHARGYETNPGLTSEVALVVDFLLGALAQRATALAAGVGVATAIVAVPSTRQPRRFTIRCDLGRGAIEHRAVAILTASTSNTFSKTAVSAVLGNARYASNVWRGLCLILAGAWVGWPSPASANTAGYV